MHRRNISEHPYKDACAEEEGDGAFFEVYQTDEGWFWSFSPVWRDAGPFMTEKDAIYAGENFLNEHGAPYIQ